MAVSIPVRGPLVATLHLDCRACPLARPRSRVHVRGVFQPLANQKALFAALKFYESLHIDFACFVDLAINFQRPKSHGKAMTLRTPHPIELRGGDIDNLAKAVNDGLVKAKILADDGYIVGQSVTKAYASDDHVAVAIWRALPRASENLLWPLNSEATKDSLLNEIF